MVQVGKVSLKTNLFWAYCTSYGEVSSYVIFYFLKSGIGTVMVPHNVKISSWTFDYGTWIFVCWSPFTDLKLALICAIIVLRHDIL